MQMVPLGILRLKVISIWLFTVSGLRIPREMVQKVKPDGSLGEVIHSETILREGIVREMEVDVIMSLERARSIKNWLDRHIKLIEKHQVKK